MGWLSKLFRSSTPADSGKNAASLELLAQFCSISPALRLATTVMSRQSPLIGHQIPESAIVVILSQGAQSSFCRLSVHSAEVRELIILHLLFAYLAVSNNRAALSKMSRLLADEKARLSAYFKAWKFVETSTPLDASRRADLAHVRKSFDHIPFYVYQPDEARAILSGDVLTDEESEFLKWERYWENKIIKDRFLVALILPFAAFPHLGDAEKKEMVDVGAHVAFSIFDPTAGSIVVGMEELARERALRQYRSWVDGELSSANYVKNVHPAMSDLRVAMVLSPEALTVRKDTLAESVLGFWADAPTSKCPGASLFRIP